MLHLAQVQCNDSAGSVELKLLACRQADNCWTLLNSEESIPLTETNAWSEGLLVLVELSEEGKILNIEHAKDWVLELLQNHPSLGMPSSFLQHEAARAEQWRQDLTLQSQDLTRQRAELEARREQIQAMEEDLERRKQQLDAMESQLKKPEED